MNTTYPQKFIGTITWLYPENGVDPNRGKFERFFITQALRPSASKLVVDCNCPSKGKPNHYTITLQCTVDDEFRGTFKTSPTINSPSTGEASGKLYTSASGLMFRGKWQEPDTMDFIMELSPAP